MNPTPPAAPLLEIRDLGVVFGAGRDARRRVVALQHVSFSMPDGEPLLYAIAGESGSGKSTLALALLGFQKPTTGTALFRGVDIYSRAGRRHQLRREIQAVFQNPFEVFNPFYRVDHVFHLLARHYLGAARSDFRERTREALVAVGLEPKTVLGRYPHQLSGGQLQRITLARIILLRPRLLIADEPVSMIDASLRARILERFLDLKENYGVSIVYITHDLSTALQISDELLVFHRGEIVERGPAERVILAPTHPYTQDLVGAIPSPDPSQRWGSSDSSTAGPEVVAGPQRGR